MIYTITLNPAIDKVIETKGFKLNETNYYDAEYDVVGGKGINVAVLLKNLGSEVKTTGLMGKIHEDFFLGVFNDLKLENNFFFYDGETRTNYKIKDLEIKSETELNGMGSTVSPKTWTNLLDYLKKEVKQGDLVIASGSVPKSITPTSYQMIGEIVNEKKATFILDSSKEWLKEGLKVNPFLIKPNWDEICQLLNYPIQTFDFEKLKVMVKEIQKLGARNVLVSLGSTGSLFFSEDGKIYQVNTAKGTLVNSVGAGDSMVAGFAYGLSKNLSIEETLKYGAASGAATAFSQWIGDRDEVEKLRKQIVVKELS